jgi:hypothetical protein
MSSKIKRNIIPIIIILIIMAACWGIVNLLVADREFSQPDNNPDNSPTAPKIGSLAYCSESTEICLDYFGFDNAGNMLVVIKNTNPDFDALSAKIIYSGQDTIYECRKVQFTDSTVYCLGKNIPPGATITLELYQNYQKDTGTLIASGRIVVTAAIAQSVNPVPTAVFASPTPRNNLQIPVFSSPTPASNPTSTTTATPPPAYP